MIKYLRSQISEIQNTKGLSLFGAFLAVSHIYAIALWNKNDFFVNLMSPMNSEPICFPFFPNCYSLMVFSNGALTAFLYFYLFLSLLSLFCFLQKDLLKYGYLSLIALTIIKLGVHLSNYNFMGNYHYMANFVYLAYLFIPHKKIVIKYLIVAFYFAAGLLKINIEWLSGAAMINPPVIMGSFLVASLFYVILLELVFVFGLLSSNKYIRWAALGQFIAFHIFSWHIVGFFYPMVMFSLLSIFIIDEFLYHKKQAIPENHLELFFFGKEKALVYTVIGIFAFLQIFPFFFAKDTSLSGSLRLSSLNMFDAKTDCKVLMIAHNKGKSAHLAPSRQRRGVRLQCDPVVFLNQIKQWCDINKTKNEFERLSFSISSRRSTDINFQPVLFLEDACKINSLLWAEYFHWGKFEK